MLRFRIRRIETLLQHRAERPLAWTPAVCVKAMRALLAQAAVPPGSVTDPFPAREGEDYLMAFWPWLLANAGRFPRWALEYAFRIGGMSLRDVHRLVDRAPAKPRRLQSAKDGVDLLEEQVETLRAEQGTDAVARARAIGYLAGIARVAIETGTLAARLEMLESVLAYRSAQTKS
jgi:hypothetical protein